MHKGPILRLAILLALTTAFCHPVGSQETGVLYLDSGSLSRLAASCTTATHWRYHGGDDPAYADPGFDDSGWEVRATVVDASEWSKRESCGPDWYRLHLRVDSSLWGRPVGIAYAIAGAAEVFLNGEPLFGLGRVGTSAETEETWFTDRGIPKSIEFSDTRDQILAVRFSAADPRLPDIAEGGIGYILHAVPLAESTNDAVNKMIAGSRQHVFLAGVTLSLALLHTLMFFLYRRFKENIYFALFTFGCAGLAVAPAQTINLPEIESFFVFTLVLKLSMVVCVLSALAVLYSLFYGRFPRQYWLFVSAGVVMAVFSGSISRTWFYAFTAIAFVELTRITVRAMVTRERMAWVIGAGFMTFIIASAWQMLSDVGVVPRVDLGVEVYLIGIMALLLSLSLYLAIRYAETSRSLEDKAALEKAHAELEEAHRDLHDTQAQLIQSEKMASLGQLVAGVAHEINNPIGAISSMNNTLTKAVDRLKEQLTASASVGESDTAGDTSKMLAAIDDANKVISSGTERVTDIVSRLRSFARLDEAELKRVDIHECLEDTLALIRHELKHNITVLREYADLPEISCFPKRLNQVLLNILINARQAIEGKGEIRISTGGVGEGQVFVAIEDTGPGIPPANLDKIFDPGFTTKGAGIGTGLGLSICYQIIKDHRGDIRVESELGRGTKFTVILPVDLEKRIDIRRP
ncbi:MAG: hypothetical protein JSW34_12135 [Candidatus Zixiibacteriota bacterium]|nr:MAG: hypothetical protein JSW34_12135 [candidate division Zixibacteria bacterium]